MSVPVLPSIPLPDRIGEFRLEDTPRPARPHLGGQVYVSELSKWHLGDVAPVVYSLDAIEGCPLYIGSTADLWCRLGQHKRRSTWWHQIDVVRWQACPTIQIARYMENYWIRTLDPMFNVHYSNDPKLARADRELFSWRPAT